MASYTQRIRKNANPRNIVVLLLAIWFFWKIIFFATRLAPGLPPDEMFHLQLIEIYSESPYLFPLVEASSTLGKPLKKFLRFGRTTEYPYLYHFALGKTLKIFSLDTFQFKTIVLLRCINMLFVSITLLYFYALCNLILKDTISVLLAFTVQTNLLMFTVVSSAVNYDNLLIMLATASLYHLTKYLRDSNWSDLLSLGILCGLGSLTKLSFLPLFVLFAAIVFIAFVMRCRQSGIKSVSSSFKTYYYSHPVSMPVSVIVLAILVVANLEFYGGNLFTYGTIFPTCEQIFSDESCATTRNGKQVAQRLPEFINSRRASIFEYFLVWVETVVSRTIGIHANVSLAYPRSFVLLFQSLLLSSFVVMLITVKYIDRYRLALFVIAVSYALFLMIFYNYRAHLQTGELLRGVQGRYLFPVLPGICLLFSYYILLPLKDSAKILGGCILMLLFVFLEIPFAAKSSDFKKVISPPNEDFYRETLYGPPSPVYDRFYNRRE